MPGVLVHEWIEKTGGAEKVLDVMAEALPDADIFSLWDDAPDRYPGRRVFETPLARSPLRRHKALALPAMLSTWRHLQSDAKYDWMLVSSHAFAHHARFTGMNREIPKFVYVHTPVRYIWAPELDARGNSLAVKAAASLFKRLDRKRAQEAVAIAAGSEFVRQRIQRTWDRDATVIYPLVGVDRIKEITD